MLQIYTHYLTILHNNGRIGAIDPAQKAMDTFSLIPNGPEATPRAGLIFFGITCLYD